MRKQIIIFLILLLCGWISTASARNEKRFNEVLVTDAETITEAVDNITGVLEQQNFDIVGVVNHAAAAESVGLELRPTQLILFSNRRQEKLLIRRGQTVGIDLPQKILVWEDEEGSIRIFYNGPGYLADRHNIRLRDLRLARIAKTLTQFGELDNGLITVDSLFSVNTTIGNLTRIIEGLPGNPFRIPFTIDFTDTEKPRIFRIRPTTLLIFGNPRVGTPLMQNQQRIGVDLPQKFLVWEDREGQVHITYNDIFFLANRHGLQGIDERLDTISDALANFASKAATPE